MRSFGALVTSTIFSVIFLIFNVYSFYDKYTTGSTYYWVNAFLAIAFLLFFINNTKDIVKKNYITFESN